MFVEGEKTSWEFYVSIFSYRAKQEKFNIKPLNVNVL
jgi:hypothetical protein